MPATHWIYPTNEQSYYSLDTQGNIEVSPQTVLHHIRRMRDEADQWLLTTGFRQMRPGDAIWIYASNPHQYIYALAQAVDVDHDGERWLISLAWDRAATERLISDPIPRSMFGQVARTAAVRADQHTSKVLDDWLTSQKVTLATLSGEPGSDEDLRLRTLRSIVLRQGQPAFRRRLLDAYDGQCAVTGERVEGVLEAAHIGGYKGAHTNRPDNGLLLRSDLHALFDLHLIGIDRDGKLVVSESLAGSTYAKLHGKPLFVPHRPQDRPLKRSLAAHLRLLSKPHR
ncbi:HNH endonuclease [Micromonosporaceae bacterium DT55]|uniref:HNH endonuclease n=1 Tax=Melissospora conviva TaxID=3388432 RepID=UPI003C24D3E0